MKLDFSDRAAARFAAVICMIGSLFVPVHAEPPAMKLSSAALLDPGTAWNSFYNSQAHTSGVAAWASRPPELKALARSLGAGRLSNDDYAVRISDYVRNNIATEFRFGLGKGGRGAVVDQSGTPFDQSHLMVELLREGGVTASYQVGTITLTAAQFGLWTGLVYNLNQASQSFSVDARAACTLLADGGIPASVNGAASCANLSGALSSVTMMHIWVSANSKLYDPSYKRHKLKTGSDFVTAMGCGSLTAATCGASIDSAGLQGATQGTLTGASYIQNTNKAAIATQLNTYARNLQSSIQSTDRFAQLDDVLGGGRVDVSYSPVIGSALPYASSLLGTWAGDIPDKCRTKLTVQFLGISQMLFSDELYGKRLRVITIGPRETWTRSSYLYLEGQQIGSATYAADVNTVDMVSLAIDHPYAASASGSALDGTYADEAIDLYAGEDYRNSQREYVYSAPGGTVSENDRWINTISVIWALGKTGPSYQALMSSLQNTHAEGAMTVNNFLQFPAQHPTTAAGFLVQANAVKRLVEAASETLLTTHHDLGLAYGIYRQEGGSIFMNMVSTLSATNAVSNETDRQAAYATYALASSVMEGSSVQQGEDGYESASAVALLSRANDDHQQLLALNSTNFSSVQSSLAANGYAAPRIALLQDMINNQYQLVLPLKATPDAVSMTGGSLVFGGGGGLAYKASRISYTVSAALKGSSSVAGQNPFDSAMKAAQLASYSLKDKQSYSLNAATGTINLTPPPDLVVGGAGAPGGLSFQRTYSSDTPTGASCPPSWVIGENANPWLCSYMDGSFALRLGNGWRHNFQITADWSNNGMEALGYSSALRASTSIASLYTVFDLYRSPTLSKRIASALVGNLMGAAFMKNSFVIHWVENTLLFVKLPDGAYDPPMSALSAQITSNESRTGPFVFASSGVTYDYAPTTFQYRSANGDVVNFAWDIADIRYAGNYYTLARPSFSILDWTTPEGVKLKFDYTTAEDLDALRTVKMLNKVTDSFGRFLTFERPQDTNVTSPIILVVTDNTGRQVTIAKSSCETIIDYPLWSGGDVFEDCKGLITVTGADGRNTIYSYIPDTSSPDPAGVLIPKLRMRKWFTPTEPNVPFLTIAYDEVMHAKSVVDTLNHPTYVFTAAVSEENDRLGEIQDALGALTRSYFDRFGNPLLQTDAIGNNTAHFYDNAHRRIETVFPEKNGVQYSYDVRSNLLSTRYYAKPGTGLADIVTSTTYSEGPAVRSCTNLKTCNKPATTTDAKSNVTTYGYLGTTGQLQTITGPSVTNGVAGQSLTTYTYTNYTVSNASVGSSTVSLLTRTTERMDATRNRVTDYTYNSGNRYALQSVIVTPGGLNLTTTFAFDAVGNVQSIDGPRAGTADTTTYVFDKMRRLTRVNAPLNSVTRYTYDYDGLLRTTRRALVQNPADSNTADPWPTDLVASQWQTESRDYWATGDLKTLTDAESNVTSYAYDVTGRVNLVTDPDGRRVGTVYNAAGQTVCTWKAWNSTSAPGGCTWDPASYTSTASTLRYAAYAYTPNGKQLGVEDANKNQTRYQYDGLDRLTYTYFPDPDNGAFCTAPTAGGAPTCTGRATYEKYDYDANGNRTSLRTRKAEVITTSYDPQNRLWTKLAQGQPQVTYGYNLMNAVISVADSTHTIAYDYDNVGRRAYERNDGRDVTYRYDAANKRDRTTWPDGYFVGYSYDALGRLEYVRENDVTELAHYQYDLLSRRQLLTLGGSGSNTVGYTYEPDNNLLTLNHAMSAAANFTFGHNHSGQIISMAATDDFYLTTPAASNTTSYTLNKLNQYVTVGASTGGASVVHDLNGNMTSWNGQDGRHTYTYDSENRLRTAAVAGSTVAGISYEYDPLGRRISKTVNGVMTRYLLDGDEEVGEYDGGWNLQRRYITGSVTDDRIAMVDSSGNKSYYHVNHQGSVLAMTGSGGVITNSGADRYAYDEYGNLNAGSATGQPFRYTGRRYDTETGLYYYRARYYSSALGRFLQVDPIWSKDDLNLYAYVGNDPLNYIDPTGMTLEEFWAGVLQSTVDAVEPVNFELDAASDAGVDDSSLSYQFGYSVGAGLAAANDPARGGGLQGLGTARPSQKPGIKEVVINKAKYPESAKHVEKAQKAGKPSVLTVRRVGARERRKEALKGTKSVEGKDRDEYPPAMFEEGGEGASVEAIDKSDNRGSGSSIRHQCTTVKDGEQVRIVCK